MPAATEEVARPKANAGRNAQRRSVHALTHCFLRREFKVIEFSSRYVHKKFGFDKAENGPRQVGCMIRAPSPDLGSGLYSL